MALEHLHKNNVVFRDLKPENILIDYDGHLKISDFGLSKKIMDKSYTLCGTPEYLAPEIILNEGHNKGVDYWSLGIMLYDMLSGYTPFYAKDPYEIYKRIIVCKYQFSEDVSMQARELISGLLE